MMTPEEEIEKLLRWTANEINKEIKLLGDERKSDAKTAEEHIFDWCTDKHAHEGNRRKSNFDCEGKLYYSLKRQRQNENDTPPLDKQIHALQRLKDMGILLEVFSLHDLEEKSKLTERDIFNHFAEEAARTKNFQTASFAEASLAMDCSFGADYKNLQKYPERELSYLLIAEPQKLKEFLNASYKMERDNKKNNANVPNTSPEIYYNQNTGKGWADGKRFTFRKGRPEYCVFPEMYKKIGKSVEQKKVLEVCGYEKDGDGSLADLEGKKQTTDFGFSTPAQFISKLAYEMRKKTGLDKNIVGNNGELTLIGKKLKFAPN